MIRQTWRKSSHSGSDSNCVELRGDLRAIRDSKNPTGPEIVTSRKALAAFIQTVKAGR